MSLDRTRVVARTGSPVTRAVAAVLAVAAAVPAGAAEGGLEEIIVTAQRRETSLQVTPVAITAVSGATLAQDKIFSAADLASISERRIERLVNPDLSGLPAFLVRKGGLHSGFMIAQDTAAALVSESKTLAHPASVDSMTMRTSSRGVARRRPSMRDRREGDRPWLITRGRAGSGFWESGSAAKR